MVLIEAKKKKMRLNALKLHKALLLRISILKMATIAMGMQQIPTPRSEIARLAKNIPVTDRISFLQ